MTRKNIALYTEDRIPMSLRNLCLYRGKSIEDIFDAVEDAENFDELTDKLRAIIGNNFVVDRVQEKYIRYIVLDGCGNKEYLKFDIVPEE